MVYKDRPSFLNSTLSSSQSGEEASTLGRWDIDSLDSILSNILNDELPPGCGVVSGNTAIESVSAGEVEAIMSPDYPNRHRRGGSLLRVGTAVHGELVLVMTGNWVLKRISGRAMAD